MGSRSTNSSRPGATRDTLRHDGHLVDWFNSKFNSHSHAGAPGPGFTATGGSTSLPGNGNKYHFFTGAGPQTLEVSAGEQGDVDIMIVGGGGQGGSYPSPGGNTFDRLSPGPPGGWNSGFNDNNWYRPGATGDNSYFTIDGTEETAYGGGGGGAHNPNSPDPYTQVQMGGPKPSPNPGPDGRCGSGGGGGSSTGSPSGSGGGAYGYPGPTSQGYPGGNGPTTDGAGGGGGAGAGGQDAPSPTASGAGGIGVVAFSGDTGIPPSYGTPGPTTGRWFAGGGGGGGRNNGSGGTGGSGGGGTGSGDGSTGGNGTANTGGGGGGGGGGAHHGGGGAGGVLVLSGKTIAENGGPNSDGVYPIWIGAGAGLNPTTGASYPEPAPTYTGSPPFNPGGGKGGTGIVIVKYPVG